MKGKLISEPEKEKNVQKNVQFVKVLSYLFIRFYIIAFSFVNLVKAF